jgi:hypothetical protein
MGPLGSSGAVLTVQAAGGPPPATGTAHVPGRVTALRCWPAEREKRAKIINAAHPLTPQLRNLQSLVELGVDRAPLWCSPLR